jgi:hypothetical protein
MRGWSWNAESIRSIGSTSFFIREQISFSSSRYLYTNYLLDVVFPYAVFVATMAVQARKRGVERAWRKPVHALPEGHIALPLQEDAESGQNGADATAPATESHPPVQTQT